MEDQPEPTLQLLLNVRQVAKLLNLGCTKVRQLIYYEGLPVVHFGRAVRVDPVQLRSWLHQREQRDISA
jgi:excisionase family DNA binding protein